MTLGITARYALQAVVELARSAASDRVTVSSIAHRNHIPESVLAKVFQRLVRSGLVVGMRGPGGGYVLARPAREITVLDVMSVFQPPPLADAHPQGAIDDHSLGELIDTVDGQVRSAFASITIDRLAAHDERSM